MTKKELLTKIQEAYEKLDDIDSSVKALKDETKELRSLLEDIPEELDEITD